MGGAGKVAVVTGANRGIGLEIVKGLLASASFSGHSDVVILTARDAAAGATAVEGLEARRGNARFHQLDITDKESIERLRLHLVAEYGEPCLDVLVNNAAMAFRMAAKEPAHVQARVTIDNNYYGTKAVSEALFPLLRPGARVVNVSSALGTLNRAVKGSEELRARFASESLTVPELDALMEEFIEAAEMGCHLKLGWGANTYGVSKAGISALSRIQDRELQTSGSPKEAIVNHVHPGFVKTGLTSYRGHIDPEEGARSSVFGATLPLGTDIRGQFIWWDCTVTDWVNVPRGRH